MSDANLKVLFNRYAKALQRSLTMRTQDPQLAADLTQESFLRLAEQGADETRELRPGYLFRTANNLLIDHQRQQLRRRTDSQPGEVLDEIESNSAELTQQVDASRRLQQVNRILAELPPRTQQVFALNRLHGLTYGQVAERLGISDSSVQKHLARALQHLTVRLREP